MSLYSADNFIEKSKMLGIDLSEEQIEKFMDYYELLVEWNSFMNLTAITDFEEVVLKHFVDSLAIYQIEVFRKNLNSSLIDVGTGAGFPGIPLKIMFPERRITLLDSLNKRVKFLNTIIEKLDMKNIEAVHGRAEDFARQKSHREQYQFCVSRAVANLSTLSELCIPFVREIGRAHV